VEVVEGEASVDLRLLEDVLEVDGKVNDVLLGMVKGEWRELRREDMILSLASYQKVPFATNN